MMLVSVEGGGEPSERMIRGCIGASSMLFLSRSLGGLVRPRSPPLGSGDVGVRPNPGRGGVLCAEFSWTPAVPPPKDGGTVRGLAGRRPFHHPRTGVPSGVWPVGRGCGPGGWACVAIFAQGLSSRGPCAQRNIRDRASDSLEMIPRPLSAVGCFRSPIRSPGRSPWVSASCRNRRGRSPVPKATPQFPNRLGGDPTPSQVPGAR